ncbi:MAG: cation:proton antiporter [Caldisericia bacterium]|nr:cation:proton antiporter [Caldisericia bacterium]
MNDLLTVIVTAIAIATLLNLLLKRVNIPTIIGYIVTGSIIGLIFGIRAHGNAQLEETAEFGIVFLMFSIGLELTLEELKAKRKELLLYGFLQVILTGSVIFAIAYFMFNINVKLAVIIGLALSLSSTAIVLKLFSETGEIKSTYGKSANGILIFQDMALIPILLLITIFTNKDRSIATVLTQTAINAAITLSILFVFGKFVLKHFFKAVANTNSKEIYMGSILLIIVSSSHLAHFFGFSYTLGAFIAGVMIADTIYKYQVEADLIPFRDLLLGIFFVSIGMQIDFHVIQNNIFIVFVILAGVMLVKIITAFIFLSFFMPNKDALKTGLSLSQTGEAALVIFSLALSSNMCDESIIQVILVASIISMVISPFIIGNMDKLIRPFFRKKSFVEDVSEQAISDNHIILCGYGNFGQSVSEKLDQGSIEHQIITGNTEAFVKARQEGKNVFFGDPADRGLLERLRVRQAMSVVVTVDDFEHLKRICASVNLIDPDINILAKTHKREDMNKLDGFNIKTMLDANDMISSTLVDDIIKSKLLAHETNKLRFLDKYDKENSEQAIEQLKLEQGRLLDIVSKTFNGIRNNEDILVIKVYHDSFTVLSGIIRNVIRDLTSNSKLESSQYNKINIILNIQHLLEEANVSLKQLAEDLAEIDTHDKTNTFSSVIVEGLDTILLSLKDIVSEYNEEDMILLKTMTSNSSKGIEKIRKTYINGKHDFDPSSNVLLLSATNLAERLIILFGEIGQDYKKLSSS